MISLRKNKTFISVMIGLIIVVLLFSVVAIVALYTSPQQGVQQIDQARLQELIEGSQAEINGTIQGSTFTVDENNEQADNDTTTIPPSAVDAALGDDTIILPESDTIQSAAENTDTSDTLSGDEE